MKEFELLTNRIVDRVNVNLRDPAFNVGPHVLGVIPAGQFAKFHAFYGLSYHHPVHFQLNHSALAGSYFLGRCSVDHSVLYKTDVRGDELKTKTDNLVCQGIKIPLHEDETIRIKNSWLIKNLVHSNSHDPESPEEFSIRNTVSMHYANIHGSSVEGCFIGPCATVDLTTLRNCVLGAYAYVQTGELAHCHVEAGRVWVRAADRFEFTYQFPSDVLQRYVHAIPGKRPEGELIDFVESRKQDFDKAFEAVRLRSAIPVPSGASLSRYAVVKGKPDIGDNVLVAQRGYLEDSILGKGANVQENCYIIHSRLDGLNVTAHGGKIVHAHMGMKIFVGFNSFLKGSPRCKLTVGDECIVMPHTIIDLEEPVEIPPRRLVWGYIRSGRDLAEHSISLEKLAGATGKVELGAMRFEGSGAEFVKAFQHRIEHILEENGAYFEEGGKRGHAQRTQNISFNIIQPHPEGPLKGIYPFMEIRQ
ncbi:MAG: transferase [Syntrophobacteraceae bacterium]|nr:transferase [Syntrophobacteraceae bacterium]